VRDNNPVLFLEFKYLYRRLKGEVRDDDRVVEIGKGAVRREGSDATLITYGSTVPLSLEAAETVAREDGMDVRVLDLRSLMPLDTELILESVRSTGKVVIVHEDNVTGGIGAEIAALIGEQAFQSLDAPVRRVGALDTPVPFAPALEEFVLPDTGKIVAALRDLNSY
jgi:2-oxoisovalerate dehydrogenase E1 component beta subunit